MMDLVERLIVYRDRPGRSREGRDLLAEACNEIDRLRLWIRRIDNINDSPAQFSKEVDDACADALSGKPMRGLIDARPRSK
jgi:hypothetical protein